MAPRRSEIRYEDYAELEDEWLELDEDGGETIKRRRADRMKSEPNRGRKRDKQRWQTPPHKREDPA